VQGALCGQKGKGREEKILTHTFKHLERRRSQLDRDRESNSTPDTTHLARVSVTVGQLVGVPDTLTSCATCGRRVTAPMSTARSSATQRTTLRPRRPLGPRTVNVRHLQLLTYTVTYHVMPAPRLETRLCPDNANLRQGVQPQPTVTWNSNPDFRINQHPTKTSVNRRLSTCRIVSKMLWIHYLVGVSHFAECRENRPVTAKKSPQIPYSAVWEVEKTKSDLESVFGTGSPPIVKFFRLVGLIIIPQID